MKPAKFDYLSTKVLQLDNVALNGLIMQRLLQKVQDLNLAMTSLQQNVASIQETLNNLNVAALQQTLTDINVQIAGFESTIGSIDEFVTVLTDNSIIFQN